jgi:CDP-glycerol glycerophosphotransferase (TagB/SpsB family)
VSKEKKLWVFGAWYGNKYADNTKYFFEFVTKNHPEIRAVWLVKKKEILDSMKSRGFDVYSKDSLRGFWLTLRAEACFVCTEVAPSGCDVNLLALSKRTFLVQLYHGIHLKKNEPRLTGLPLMGALKTRIFMALLPMLKKYSLVTVTSDEAKDKTLLMWDTPPERIVITGYPRNDIFFQKKVAGRSMLHILYAPTYRQSEEKEIKLFEGFDAWKVNEFLSRENAILSIKTHPGKTYRKTAELIREITQDKRSIQSLDVDDIYEVLPGVDVLINDFSSVYFDYLLLDRPIVFAAFDLEDYIEDRGIFYDYDKSTPGPKAKDWDDVLTYIKEALMYPDKYKEDRERVRKKFHKFTDGNSSKRVFDEVVARVCLRN